MIETYRNWKLAASSAVSYRQMYGLSAEICEIKGVSREVANAARRVVKILGDVMDAPIADAGILRKARKLFSKLTISIDRAIDATGTCGDFLPLDGLPDAARPSGRF